MVSTTLVDNLLAAEAGQPGKAAIVEPERETTYAELAAGAAAIAGALGAAGVGPGDRVALLAENSSDYIAAYYGILAAGGVVVALNTAASERELGNWLAHSGAEIVLVGGGAGRLPDSPDVRALRIDELLVAQTGNGGLAPPVVDTDDPAAIIYTSGTTGAPKGVTLSHRNLVANVDSILAYLGLGAGDRVLNVLPFYYSYGNSILHTHVAAGGCLVLENGMVYPHRVVERLAETACTGFSGVPSTFALLLSRVKFDSDALASLRYLTQAGGAMSPASIERLRAALPGREVYVMYGQTEATARLAYLPPERLDDKPGSIGRAIPGVELSLRDRDGRVVEPGETGEIWARGDNIMLGYWADVERTREVIQDGWLRTGDLARADEEGFLYIVGRASEMIKSGAHRISPKEIEEVIMELNGIEDAAVVGVEDETLGQTIAGYIVPCPDAVLTERDVLHHCRTNLSRHKIPRTITFVDELPRTPSGKVRRFLLGRSQGTESSNADE